MCCPCLILSAVCNYENLNLFILQALMKSRTAVGSYCGREGRADATGTTLPECGKQYIFLNRSMNSLK